MKINVLRIEEAFIAAHINWKQQIQNAYDDSVLASDLCDNYEIVWIWSVSPIIVLLQFCGNLANIEISTNFNRNLKYGRLYKGFGNIPSAPDFLAIRYRLAWCMCDDTYSIFQMPSTSAYCQRKIRKLYLRPRKFYLWIMVVSSERSTIII